MAQGPVTANRKRLGVPLWAVLFVGGALIVACGPRTAESPPAYADAAIGGIVIRDMASGQDLAFAELIDKLAETDALLLGEQHDNPDHHRMQARIARELAARGRRLVVAFEMIDSGQQPLLDGFLANRPRDAAALGDMLGWDQSGWPEWAQYRPIADTALAQQNPPAKPIRPANLPIATARDIARNGLTAKGLDAALAETLRQAGARDPAVLAAHGEDIRDSHCGMLPDSALAPFALAQYARDSVMADSIAAASRDDPRALVLLIAGNGHARRDLGVPLHLARLRPGLKVMSIGLLEGDAPPETAPFDLIWLSAPMPREDHCAAFRASARR